MKKIVSFIIIFVAALCGTQQVKAFYNASYRYYGDCRWCNNCSVCPECCTTYNGPGVAIWPFGYYGWGWGGYRGYGRRGYHGGKGGYHGGHRGGGHHGGGHKGGRHGGKHR